MRRTHYRSSAQINGRGEWPTACNRTASYGQITDTKRLVTCGVCRKTEYFAVTQTGIVPGSPDKREPKTLSRRHGNR